VVAEVFWRPGCRYCSALRRELSRQGVPTSWHNIWADEQARQFVRSVNRGSETVPTVRVGSRTLTNPRAAQVSALVGGDSGVQQGRPFLRRVWWAVSLLPLAGLITASELVTRQGPAGVGYLLDAVAVAAWLVTRPLRR